jgi:hypothetical protein
LVLLWHQTTSIFYLLAAAVAKRLGSRSPANGNTSCRILPVGIGDVPKAQKQQKRRNTGHGRADHCPPFSLLFLFFLM